MHVVKKVEYLGGYRLKLHFSNREIKVIDLEEDLKKSHNKFTDLLDVDFFKKVKCVGDSIAWPNGIDYCPDWLYMNGIAATAKRSRRKTAARTSVRRRKKPVSKV